jgi:cupin superfamily acireductone dioxygenase involved in methionine salvage
MLRPKASKQAGPLGQSCIVQIFLARNTSPFWCRRKSHLGVESAFILEGGGVFFVKGQPDRQFKAMDNWQVPPEVPHSLRNGDKTTKLAITYVVEKDKPLASPAPE